MLREGALISLLEISDEEGHLVREKMPAVKHPSF
jgi:hypothetical protein